MRCARTWSTSSAGAVLNHDYKRLYALIVQRTVGLRVSPEVEVEGLDTAIHAESAYDFGNVRAGRMG